MLFSNPRVVRLVGKKFCVSHVGYTFDDAHSNGFSHALIILDKKLIAVPVELFHRDYEDVANTNNIASVTL